MYKKKAFVRKPLRKYKAKPKTPINRSLRYIQNFIHPVVCCTTGTFSCNTTTGFSNTLGSGTVASTSLQFSITQNGVSYKLGSSTNYGLAVFANSSSLSNVYDAYRIKKVVCSWMFSNNSSPINSTTHTLPILYSVIDKDDSNPLGGVQTALAYSDCKITQLGNMRGDGLQYITLYNPAVETDVTTVTGTFVSAVRGTNQWMDTDDTSAAFNGIKMFIDSPGSTSATGVLVGSLTVYFRVFLEYKENH